MITRLPIIPLPAGGAYQYPLHEYDLMKVVALSVVDHLPSGPLAIAPALPVTFRELLCTLAAQEGHKCRFVQVTWRVVYWGVENRGARADPGPVPR